MLEILRIYLRKNKFKLASTKPEVVGHCYGRGSEKDFHREKMKVKQGDDLIS